MNRVLWQCICLSIVLLFACDRENIDITAEEEKPFDPEVVELENVLSYGLAQETFYDDDGYGGKFFDGLYYIVSSNPIICQDNSATVELSGEDPFILEITRVGEDSFSLRSAYLLRLDEGIYTPLFTGPESPAAPLECLTSNASFTLLELTDDYMRATFEANFYYFILGSPDVEDCDSYANYGVISASFSVPIINCD